MLERCDDIGNEGIISKDRKEYILNETPQIPNDEQNGNKVWNSGKHENLSKDIISDTDNIVCRIYSQYFALDFIIK